MFIIDNEVPSRGKDSAFLKGDQIVEVILQSVEVVQGDVKERIVCTFKGVDQEAIFNDSIFEIDIKKDAERHVTDSGSIFPSALEKFNLQVKNYIRIFNPEAFAKIESGTPLKGKDWTDFRNKVIELIKKGIGQKTWLKLLKNKDGYACLPSLGALTKEGKLFQPKSSNFIGDKSDLEFSEYELKTINLRNNVKPSPMPISKKDDLDEFDDEDTSTNELPVINDTKEVDTDDDLPF